MRHMQSIERLFRLYYRPLCLYALHYLDDSAEVEDVVQEAFEALWEKMSSDEVQSPKAYLYTIVRNKCISQIRTGKDVVSSDAIPENLTDDEAIDRSFSESALWTAIDNLPKKRRQMLLMEKRDGMSIKEIAQTLGVSEGTVKNQISRALKTLREQGKEILLHFFIF